MNNRSSSNNLDRENENIDLEPLLSSNQQSIDTERRQRNPSSLSSLFISRMMKFRFPMSHRSSRTLCFDILKTIPVGFILSIVAWSYYAYVIQMCIFTIENVPKKVVYLLIYHPLLFVFLWSYYRTITQRLMGPPSEFYVGDAESERIALAQTLEERRSALIRFTRRQELPILTRHFDGSIRYCFLCRCIKPDRAHHCSLCGKCVLRYDHHCPWTNSCISFANYKYFVLFLGWALSFCAYVALTSLEYFILFWQGIADTQKDGTSTVSTAGRFHVLFLFFASIMFAISVASLFFYHLFLTGKNRTTLESFRAPIFANGPQKDGFDLGCKQNFHEIFGKRLISALIPVPTTRGDGVHYQVNSALIGSLQEQQLTRTNDDVLLPMETPSTADRNYLLSENNTNR